MDKNSVIREWEIELAKLFDEYLVDTGMTHEEKQQAIHLMIYRPRKTVNSEVAKTFVENLIAHKAARIRAEAKTAEEAALILEQ